VGVRFLSVCSGIEAASVAWHDLGWTPVAFSEIEAFPCALLAHHYPSVPNLGDMTKFKEWPDATIDVLVGGTPCQAFSVAGLRQGLADPRGNLTLTFLAIAERYRPQWVVWENVPGVLSDRTGAFAALLGGLAELRYGWAYRVLDAQYFGLAQRRKRVFVVASARGWAAAAAVLFEPESLRGDPAPSRRAREGTADSVAHSLRAGGFDASEDGIGRGIPLTVGALTDGAHNGGGLNGQDAYTGRIIPVPQCWRNGPAGLRDGDAGGGA
jgi:DNA (cytosine-5)-methyltransferase 1